ncbi:unnamed protein product [Parnassius apollo]|uniref:(apollo) hypothetical protein n=1 Tax=Parnassius apollo TaxID=110799 RepID=A0A8S3X6L9_PARAO|nr:unnamed protein product [Parnassius apollo]
MEPNKDKRMGKKTSVWPSVARKQRCRVKGRFSNANKENIPARMNMSESCSTDISRNTANVAKNPRQANIVATLPPNWSSKQMIVQAEVHNAPSRSNWKYTNKDVVEADDHEVPRKMMHSYNYQHQSDWDIIEPDVAFARNTPDLITPVTQTELTSPCNQSSDSNLNINLPVEIISKDNSNVNTSLEDRLRRLYNAVTGVVAHARQLEVPTAEKLLVLKEDLRNGPCHVFGWHDICKPYYCRKKIEENLVPQLKSSGMWHDIYDNLGWLLQNAESLLLKETNNPVEQFNAIVAKFLAGKRVNFTLRGTYEARCFAAAGHYNSKDYTFMRKVQNAVCPEVPDNTYTYTDKYVQKKKTKILTKQRKRTAADKAQGNKKAKRFKMADKHYGDVIEVPDMPQEEFEKKRTEFILALKLAAEEICVLEKRTIAQGNSDLWIVERKKRLTASIFGQVCKMKDSTPCTSLVKTILYSTFTGNDATRYGKTHEATAIADLEKKN